MNPFNQPLQINNTRIDPPLMLAPMAGITHSAFRRLVADFGGYGALCTEMLSATALLAEDLLGSPFTRRRPSEGRVFYQLRLTGEEDIRRVIDKLKTIDPFGIDINLGCPAPEIRKSGGGQGLFDNGECLEKVIAGVRKEWLGPLTVKCRLGRPGNNWQSVFKDRMKLFEETGVDSITVHPRFSDEKLKRRARWDLFPWIAALSKLPIIVNGDITQPDAALLLLEKGCCKGLMIGRIAAVKPWIFREFCGEKLAVDYGEIWTREYGYIMEDFKPEKAIGRIKEFSSYFAQNFIYGHQFYKAVQGAKDLDTLKKRAVEFLKGGPEVEKEPSVMGL